MLQGSTLSQDECYRWTAVLKTPPCLSHTRFTFASVWAAAQVDMLYAKKIAFVLVSALGLTAGSHGTGGTAYWIGGGTGSNVWTSQSSWNGDPLLAATVHICNSVTVATEQIIHGTLVVSSTCEGKEGQGTILEIQDGLCLGPDCDLLPPPQPPTSPPPPSSPPSPPPPSPPPPSPPPPSPPPPSPPPPSPPPPSPPRQKGLYPCHADAPQLRAVRGAPSPRPLPRRLLGAGSRAD